MHHGLTGHTHTPVLRAHTHQAGTTRQGPTLGKLEPYKDLQVPLDFSNNIPKGHDGILSLTCAPWADIVTCHTHTPVLRAHTHQAGTTKQGPTLGQLEPYKDLQVPLDIPHNTHKVHDEILRFDMCTMG